MRGRSFFILVPLSVFVFLAACSRAPVGPSTPTAHSEAKLPAIDPVSVASISGIVHFTGTAPAPQKIDMTADSGCKGQNESETMEVSDGRLANALVYVKDGLQGYSFAAPATKVTIAQQGCKYVPHVAAVLVGQSVEFLDNDDTLHNIHPIPKSNKEWNQSQMPNGGQFSRTFNSPEIMIPVKCNQHPWMKMYLNVLGNPFFAVTGKDGSFSLRGLPPGTYTLAAVHEKLGEQEMKVTVGPKDEKKDADFVFRQETAQRP